MGVYMMLGFVVVLAAILWRSGSTPISDELRTSLSPQDLEDLQKDLSFRRLLGQLVLATTSFLFLLWLVW